MVKFFQVIFDIYKKHHMTGRIHSLKITVAAIIDAVHHCGTVIKIGIAKILSDRCSFIKKMIGFFCQNESLCLMLPDTVLPMPVKYILVMFNLHNLCLWKPQKDLFCTRMIADAAFHINMGKPCIITHVL